MKTENIIDLELLSQGYSPIILEVNGMQWPVYYQIKNSKEVHLLSEGASPMINFIEAVARCIDEREFSSSLIPAEKLQWRYRVEQDTETHSGEISFERICEVDGLPSFHRPKFFNKKFDLK